MKCVVIIAIGLAATGSLLARPSTPAAQGTGSAATGEAAEGPATGSGVGSGAVPVGAEGSGVGAAAPPPPVAASPIATPPVPATVEGRSRFLFPSLQLTASTDASAKLKVAFGYAVGNAGPGNVTIWPRLETTSSKGVTTLFSSKDDESLPVQLGVVVNYALPERGLSENMDAERAAMSHVYDVCADRCAADPKCPFKRTDSDDAKASATIKQLVNGKCTDAAELWAAYERTLPIRRSFPRFRISGGGSYVTQDFKYLTGAPGPMILRDEKTERHTAFRLAAAADYTWPGSEGAGWILEGRASYGEAWNASSTTVRSCTPEGSLSADGMSTLELCKDKTIGAPTMKQLATFELTFGAGDTERQSYRWAAGVFTTVPIGKDRNSIGLELPVYLNFATSRAPAGYVGDYKGFLRITPQIQWTRRDDQSLDRVILLVVEALGQRAYFPDALD
jgi:hypothetical protein